MKTTSYTLNEIVPIGNLQETGGVGREAALHQILVSVVKYLCSVLALICERLRRSCWSVSAGVGVV